MQYNKMKLLTTISRAEGLLAGLWLGIDQQEEFNIERSIKCLGDVKALVATAEQILHGMQPNKDNQPQLPQTHVMRPLLDEVENISKAALLKLANHAKRPLSGGAIEAKAVLSVTEHLLGFILSNGA